jgi:hypothetical protein
MADGKALEEQTEQPPLRQGDQAFRPGVVINPSAVPSKLALFGNGIFPSEWARTRAPTRESGFYLRMLASSLQFSTTVRASLSLGKFGHGRDSYR